MKKLIAWLLLLTLMVSLFAGCKKSEVTPTEPDTTISEADLDGINAAIDYLKDFYKDDGSETPIDYERFGIVRIGGVPYEVVWTVDVGEDLIKIIVNDDGTVTIDVNEDCEEDTPYVLTATITDAAGNSVSHSWNYILPKAQDMVAIVKAAYALQPGESLPYESRLRGKVISIDTIWSDEYQNITVTIEIAGAEDMPIKCYRMKGTADTIELMKDIKVGNIITVTGTLKNYNGTIEFDTGCLMIAWEKGDAVDAPTDPGEILKAAYALAQDQSLPYVATLTGTVTEIDTPYDPSYGNISVVMVVDGYPQYPILCYRLKGTDVDQIAVKDQITVTGIIKNYKGTIEYDAGCQMINRVSGGGKAEGPSSDPNKIIPDALKLKSGEKLSYRATLTGEIVSIDNAYDPTYDNITVTIKVQGYKFQCYRMVGEGINLIRETDTITVTGIIENYNGKLEFGAKCTLDGWSKGPRNINYGPLSEGVAYKMYIDQKTIGKTIYFDGSVSGTRLQTTTAGSKAVDVFVEKVSGKGLLLYYMNGSVKTYIGIEEYTNDSGKQRGRAVVSTDTKYYWVYSSDVGLYYVNLPTAGKYFLGTYSDFATVSASWIGYVDGSMSSSSPQYIAKFMKASEVPADPETGTGTSTVVTAPQVGVAYKLGFDQLAKKEIYYFTGAMSKFYGATDTDATKGVNVYLEKAANGYKVYFKDSSNVKQYLYIVVSGTHVNFSFSTSNASVFAFDAEKASLKTTLDDGTVHYMGTKGSYVTFDTIRESNKDNADYYLSHLYLTTGTGGPSTGAGEEPGTEEPVKPTIPTGSFVIYNAKDGKIVTSTVSVYEAKQKEQLAMADATLANGKVTTSAADALVVTLVTNSDKTVSFKTADGKYLHADGTHVNLSATQNDNTKFVLEETSGGYFMKLANATYNDKAQYLEYYGGCLTSFGMGTNTAIYTFAFYPLTDGEKPTEPEPSEPTPSEPTGSFVIYNAKDGKIVTSTVSVYEAKQKEQLAMADATLANGKVTTSAADALVVTLVTNSDKTVSFKTADGKYLHADGTHVNLSATQNDNTKFVLEETSGGYFMKLANATYNDKAQYLEYYGGCLTSYGMSTNTAIYTFAFYPLADGETPTEPTPTEPTPSEPSASVSLETGDQVVIYAPAYNKALSADKVNANSYYNKGVDITVSNGTVSGYTDAEVWTVTKNADGSYSFANGGQNIGMADSFSSMNLGEANDDWNVISLGGSLYNIKNVVRGNFIEWFASKTNWSTYNSSSAATDDQYQLSFYVIGKGILEEEPAPSEPETTVPTEPETTVPSEPETTVPSEPSASVSLETGDRVVIYAPAYNKALSADKVNANSYYNKGVDITVSNGTVSGYTDAEVWTVTKNADGSYSFANGGQNIGMADSFSSMNLGEANDDWNVISLGGSLYNIKNVVRGNFIEWFASKTNWSTYNSSSAATDDQYQLSFYVIGKGILEEEPAPTEPDTTEPETTKPDTTEPGAANTATLSLTDKAATRTSYSTEKQVWEQNGIKLTNDKAGSTSNVGDYAPLRLYKSSSVTIECAGMTKIVFYCNDYKDTYAGALRDSITDKNVTVSVDGLVVTVEFAEAKDSFTISSLSNQVRLDSLTVTFAEATRSQENLLLAGLKNMFVCLSRMLAM